MVIQVRQRLDEDIIRKVFEKNKVALVRNITFVERVRINFGGHRWIALVYILSPENDTAFGQIANKHCYSDCPQPLSDNIR